MCSFSPTVYPHAADIDMLHRAKVMDPPLKEHQWLDVLAVHGKRTDTSYMPGAWLPDDPHDKEESDLTHFTGVTTDGMLCVLCLLPRTSPTTENPVTQRAQGLLGGAINWTSHLDRLF
jgi:hypothetical protein